MTDITTCEEKGMNFCQNKREVLVKSSLYLLAAITNLRLSSLIRVVWRWFDSIPKTHHLHHLQSLVSHEPRSSLMSCEFPDMLEDRPYCFSFLLEVPFGTVILIDPRSQMPCTGAVYYTFWQQITPPLICFEPSSYYFHLLHSSYIKDPVNISMALRVFLDNIDILLFPLNLFRAEEPKSTESFLR